MDRLINFLLRIVLRTVVVLLISLWGVSRISTLDVTRMSGFTAQQFTVCREGIAISELPGDLVPAGYYWLGESRSWNPPNIQQLRRSSFLGVNYWRTQRNGFRQVGVSYLTMIVPILVVYAVLSRTRRKRLRGNLKQRLTTASEEAH